METDEYYEFPEPSEADLQSDAPAPQNEEEAYELARRRGYYRRMHERASKMFALDFAAMEQRKQKTLEPIKNRIDWYETALENWHRAELAAGRAPKTINFPDGSKSALARAQPEIEVEDWEALLASAEEIGIDGDLFPEPALEKRLSKSGLRDYVKRFRSENAEPGTEVDLVNADGQELKGVKVTEQQPNWSGGKIG